MTSVLSVAGPHTGNTMIFQYISCTINRCRDLVWAFEAASVEHVRFVSQSFGALSFIGYTNDSASEIRAGDCL